MSRPDSAAWHSSSALPPLPNDTAALLCCCCFLAYPLAQPLFLRRRRQLSHPLSIPSAAAVPFIYLHLLLLTQLAAIPLTPCTETAGRRPPVNFQAVSSRGFSNADLPCGAIASRAIESQN